MLFIYNLHRFVHKNRYMTSQIKCINIDFFSIPKCIKDIVKHNMIM